MFRSISKGRLSAALACILLSAGCIYMSVKYTQEAEKNKMLEKQLAELSKKEKRAIIDQSINKQMEDIAYEQKKISDERTEEANRQAQRAELEKQNAIHAQQQAKASEALARKEQANAEMQRNEANSQRRQAETQREKAELNKRAADTLRFIALGRSLGSQSSQTRASNKRIANLLAYASYYFTESYKQKEADLYNSAVFNALTEGSYTKQTWSTHKGLTTAISFDSDKSAADKRFVTVSSYGEIKRHTFDPVRNRITQTETIFANSQYDFRHVLYRHGNIYALSFTGHIVVKKSNWTLPRVIPLTGIQHPTAFCETDKGELFIVGTQSIGIFDKTALTLTGTRQFDFTITCLGKDFSSLPIFFDNLGRIHRVKSLNDIKTEKMPNGINGQVTAYANSKSEMLEAYGTKDGTIFVMRQGERPQALTGHESRITKLKLVKEKIYSSSYDGNLYLWIFNKRKNEKIEPLALLNTNNWMLNFDFDDQKERVWTCGQDGTITKSLIKIKLMTEKMQEEILPSYQDFSPEEWNYFIGADVKQVPFIHKNRKEGKK